MDTFERIRGEYFSKDLVFYQPYITPAYSESHSNAEYYRIPVYRGECMVVLMLWGPGASTAIHDHAGARGSVKVLAGTVREDRYQYRNGELHRTATATGTPGAILHVTPDDLHAVSNPTTERSISVHVYDTASASLDGTTIYDPEQKRIGTLNDRATRSSWREQPEAFKQIVPF